MMKFMDSPLYVALLDRTIAHFPYWEQLSGKALMLTGASGMIGSFLTDLILHHNRTQAVKDPCRVIGTGRDAQTAKARFEAWWGEDDFIFFAHDVREPYGELPCTPDFMIHGASTTHPKAYATEPINTVLSNVLGTQTLLDAAARQKGCRFLLLSSVEIYGENRGDIQCFSEESCGYINCNTLRAGYPEGKRVSEALCQAYRQEKGVDSVIIRLPRSYGPTMRFSDTKAVAQFIKKGTLGEDIVLKSKGTQLYSYLHVADAVLAILWVLVRGESGQAYNAGDSRSDISLYDLASEIADYAGSKVVFELPDEIERKGYSTATKALMDASKLKSLGWSPIYSIQTGIRETIELLRQLQSTN